MPLLGILGFVLFRSVLPVWPIFYPIKLFALTNLTNISRTLSLCTSGKFCSFYKSVKVSRVIAFALPAPLLLRGNKIVLRVCSVKSERVPLDSDWIKMLNNSSKSSYSSMLESTSMLFFRKWAIRKQVIVTRISSSLCIEVDAYYIRWL